MIGEFYKIREKGFEEMEQLKEYIKINVSRDKMKASISQIKTLTDEIFVTKQDIMHLLEEENIVYGIDEEAVERIAKKMNIEKMIDGATVVAKGLNPEKGKDAYLLPLQFTKERKIDENELYVDLKQVVEIPNVTQGQLVGEKIPATEGVPGKNVHGEEVPPKPGKDFILRKGKNTRIEDLKIYAIVDGQVCIERKVIHVLPVYEVKGDVDMSVGNIDFVGNVVIKGNVLTGFEVKAKGDIRVYGTVEGAKLEAGGSIYIQAGIVAQKGGLIKAKNDLHSSFINQANIEVDGNVYVTQGILHSKCEVGGSIFCTRGKGTIVGGEISVGNDIDVNELGNAMGTPTAIFVGTQKKLLDKEKVLTNTLENSKEELVKIEKLRKAFELKEKKGIPLTQKERISKLRIRSSILLLNEKIRQATEDLQELKEQLGAPQYGNIKVRRYMYPNVNISFGKYSRKITKKYQNVKIEFIDKEISILTI